MILVVAPSGGGDSCYDIGDDCSNGNGGGGDDIGDNNSSDDCSSVLTLQIKFIKSFFLILKMGVKVF